MLSLLFFFLWYKGLKHQCAAKWVTPSRTHMTLFYSQQPHSVCWCEYWHCLPLLFPAPRTKKARGNCSYQWCCVCSYEYMFFNFISLTHSERGSNSSSSSGCLTCWIFWFCLQVMCLLTLMQTLWGRQRNFQTVGKSTPFFLLKAAQMFSLDQENISTSPASTKAQVKYGELIVLG